MAIRILVNGAKGRMGQVTVNMLNQHAGFILAGEADHQDDLAQAIKQANADVVVDFTNPEAVYQNIKTIIASGARPVIGTTGLQREQIHELQTQCAQLKRGGIIAPNFSLGAVLMMKCASEIAGYFPQAEIIEMHHDGKIDSPSGTAIRAAEMLAENRGDSPAEKKPSRETLPGARGANLKGTPIHAIRLPGLLAHLQIIFGNTGETLTFRHDTIDRACFMPGVRLACEKVMGLEKLIYGLEGVL